MASISSINIYKKAFELNLELESLVYDNDDSLEEEVDFEKLINSQRNVCETNIVDNAVFTKKKTALEDTDLRSEVHDFISESIE